MSKKPNGGRNDDGRLKTEWVDPHRRTEPDQRKDNNGVPPMPVVVPGYWRAPKSK